MKSETATIAIPAANLNMGFFSLPTRLPGPSLGSAPCCMKGKAYASVVAASSQALRAG
jgi:hypothetical protein